MKKYIFPVLFVVVAHGANAAHFETLAEDTASWDGQAIVYPEGQPLVTAIKLQLEPGGQLPFHCHPFSTVGYVSAGEIEVEKLNGEKKKFIKGDTIVEVANTWHRGANHSEEQAELIGFYIGLKDKKNTIMMTEENKDLCK